MEIQKYTIYEVPNVAGDPELIYKRASFGQARRESLRYFRNTEIEALQDDLKRVEKQHGTISYSGFDRIKHLRPFPPFEDYRLDLSGVISPQEKQRIFKSSVTAMQQIMAKYGIEGPDEEDILSRLFIVDRETFTNILYQELSDKYIKSTGRIAGITLFNARLSFVDFSKSLSNDSIRETGIHELWHTMGYKTLWVPVGSNPTTQTEDLHLARHGLIIGSSPNSNSQRDLDHFTFFDEGLTELLTQETLKLAGEKPYKPRYKIEAHKISELVANIGLEPLIQALLTKRGLRNFHKALKQLT